MNANALKANIVGAGMTNQDFCKRAGIPYATFHKRMNGKVDFKITEVKRIAKVLNLDRDRVHEIFLA